MDTKVEAPSNMRIILESDINTIKKWNSVFGEAGIITAIVRPDCKKS